MSPLAHIRASCAALTPSNDSRRRERASKGPRDPSLRERGVALIVALTAVAILSIMLADMHESTGTGFVVATSQRDALRAEYMAKSGLNLTRLLVANEPRVRMVVAPIYQMLTGRPPPQLSIWKFSNQVLRPFCDYEGAMASLGEASASSLSAIEGLGKMPGTCQIAALAENSKINVNDPLFLDNDRARRSTAMQLFALLGGYQLESPYDPIFEQRDPDGLFTSRLDVVTSVIDWWDYDTERTTFDPGAGDVASSGTEEDVYRTFDDSYQVKNAPFDSLEELRLIRGMSDDLWATFVEPNPDDPDARAITIYGSGAVNPNEAPPEVLLARLCSFLEGQSLCQDPAEASKFIQLVRTIRSIIPLPFFTRSNDFLNFVEGKGGARDLYPMLQAFLGPDNPLLFVPIVIPQNIRAEVDRSFVTAARILTIESTGVVGRTRVRLRAVVNHHERWTPPPPNAGSMPPLGIFHYYRVD